MPHNFTPLFYTSVLKLFYEVLLACSYDSQHQSLQCHILSMREFMCVSVYDKLFVRGKNMHIQKIAVDRASSLRAFWVRASRPWLSLLDSAHYSYYYMYIIYPLQYHLQIPPTFVAEISMSLNCEKSVKKNQILFDK